MPVSEEEQMQNKLINEEYKIWKKNSIFLYDIMYRYAHHVVNLPEHHGADMLAVARWSGPPSPPNGSPT